METAELIRKQMKALISEKFYPCIAAVQSLAKDDYVVEICESFGDGRDREKIRRAVFDFLDHWKKDRSTTYTLWVTYPNDQVSTEEEFESRMWSELTNLTSVEERETDWAPEWSQDPQAKNFTFCMHGYAFFVVGLHPQSSRKGRRFPHPTLIFNVYDQFRDLQTQGLYHPMVEKNRVRDLRYSESANPMAVRWGDDWEAIQFSGKENSESWKCPFHFKAQS